MKRSARALLRRCVVAGLQLLLLAPAAVVAGPWNRPPQSVYAKLGYSVVRATQLATPDGQIADIPAFTKNEVGIYAEYGLTERLMGIVDAIAYRRSEIEDFDLAGGIGDTRFGLQWALRRSGPWVFAAKGFVQAPTGDETKGLALLPTGSGAWEGGALLGAGGSLWGGRGWAYAEAGHLFRGRGLRDSFLYEAQLGVRAAGPVLVMFNLRGVQPYDTAPGDLSAGSAAGFGDGVTYLNYGPAAIVELGGGFGVQIDVDAPANTRNIARGTTFRFGLFLNR